MIDEDELAPEWITRIWQMEGEAEKFSLGDRVTPLHTQYPNFYLDWMMAYLTPEEFKVLSYIVRRTFGFHDEEYPKQISIGQMSRGLVFRENRKDLGTGLGEGTIGKAVDGLEAMGLIICHREFHKASWYAINQGKDPRYPFQIKALATREANRKQHLIETMAKSREAREEGIARTKSGTRVLELQLVPEVKPCATENESNTVAQGFIAEVKHCATGESKSVAQGSQTLSHSDNRKKGNKERKKGDETDVSLSPSLGVPGSYVSIAGERLDGGMPLKDQGAIRKTAKAAFRAEKKQAKQGAAEIVAGWPEAEQKKVKNYLWAYLRGVSPADRIPSEPDAEMMVKEFEYVLTIDEARFDPDDFLAATRHYHRVFNGRVSVKTMRERLCEWDALLRPK